MNLKAYPHVYANVAAVPAEEFAARWPNFSPREIACRGTGRVAIDFEAMDTLQRLRTRVGRPLIVNSAYRSPEHNRNVNGAPGSLHLTAKAFDISMSNHKPADFEVAARAVGFKGFGFYRRSNFIHVDTGPARSWGERFPATATGLPVEREAEPETLSEDKAATGALIGGGGSLAGAVAVLPAIGALSPIAQVVAVAAFIVGIGALAYIFRNRIKALAK